MTTTPTTYACPRHPRARVTLHVRASAHCTHCGKPLRRAEAETRPKTTEEVLHAR